MKSSPVFERMHALLASDAARLQYLEKYFQNFGTTCCAADALKGSDHRISFKHLFLATIGFLNQQDCRQVFQENDIQSSKFLSLKIIDPKTEPIY